MGVSGGSGWSQESEPESTFFFNSCSQNLNWSDQFCPELELESRVSGAYDSMTKIAKNAFLSATVFSLLFEVADKSFKVADRAIRHTRWRGGRFVTRGSVTEEWQREDAHQAQNVSLETRCRTSR